MTADSTNAVSNRFQEIMYSHMDSVMVEVGESETDNMVGLLEGRLSCVMIRQENKLVLVYMPRLATQFIFDCYGT